MSDQKKLVGWHKPLTSRKAHLFTSDRRSLCGRYGAFGVVDFDYDIAMESPDNCKACWAKYLKTDHAKEAGYD